MGKSKSEIFGVALHDEAKKNFEIRMSESFIYLEPKQFFLDVFKAFFLVFAFRKFSTKIN
jgi:hypothetical protein